MQQHSPPREVGKCNQHHGYISAPDILFFETTLDYSRQKPPCNAILLACLEVQAPQAPQRLDFVRNSGEYMLVENHPSRKQHSALDLQGNQKKIPVASIAAKHFPYSMHPTFTIPLHYKGEHGGGGSYKHSQLQRLLDISPGWQVADMLKGASQSDVGVLQVRACLTIMVQLNDRHPPHIRQPFAPADPSSQSLRNGQLTEHAS